LGQVMKNLVLGSSKEDSREGQGKKTPVEDRAKKALERVK